MMSLGEKSTLASVLFESKSVSIIYSNPLKDVAHVHDEQDHDGWDQDRDLHMDYPLQGTGPVNLGGLI